MEDPSGYDSQAKEFERLNSLLIGTKRVKERKDRFPWMEGRKEGGLRYRGRR